MNKGFEWTIWYMFSNFEQPHECEWEQMENTLDRFLWNILVKQNLSGIASHWRKLKDHAETLPK